MLPANGFPGKPSMWFWLTSLSVLVSLVSACADRQESASEAETGASRSVELKLLVIDDPPMAAAIERLRAEWQAHAARRLWSRSSLATNC